MEPNARSAAAGFVAESIADADVTRISGSDVPTETMVKPIMTSAMPILLAIPLAPSMKKSTEEISKTMEIISKKIVMPKLSDLATLIVAMKDKNDTIVTLNVLFLYIFSRPNSMASACMKQRPWMSLLMVMQMSIEEI